MRINQFVARATGLSRRATDTAVLSGRVKINGAEARLGQQVDEQDDVSLDSITIKLPETYTTVIVNKPIGYVCSRDGQGSPSIYELLPEQYAVLKPVGRLDKDSSGLILLTNDGQLAQDLGHPSNKKHKVYEVRLNKTLSRADSGKIIAGKVILDERPSVMLIEPVQGSTNDYVVTLEEGRNRQIRRTFSKLGYEVVLLNRIQFGEFKLSQLGDKSFIEINNDKDD